MLECPCGPVAVSVASDMTVSFESVPAFVERRDDMLALPQLGNVAFDIAYGGAFYAILPARRLGLDLLGTPLGALIDAGTRFTASVRRARTIRHPREPDLAFLYGTILTDDAAPGAPTRNLCIFGEGQVDRSPTGSGVTARVALDVARGAMALGDAREFRGVSDVPFVGEALRREDEGVIVRVAGKAHHSGEATFVVEDDDPLADGLALGGAASWPVRTG
jgi:trans-L-3-hydroxyproline dehydratase